MTEESSSDSSSSSTSSSSGATSDKEDDQDARLPVPAGRRAAPRGPPQRRWSVKGGCLVLRSNTGHLGVVCKYHTNCTMVRSFGRGYCRGNPMGSALRWLRIGSKLGKTAHQKCKKRMSQRKRQAARDKAASKPHLLELFRKEKGYDAERSTVAAEPDLPMEASSSSDDAA